MTVVQRGQHGLWSLTRGQRGRYAAAIGALALGNVFLFATPLISMVVIDGLLLPAGEAQAEVWIEAPVRWLRELGSVGEGLVLCAGLLVVCTAIAGLFQYLRGRWAAQASEAIVRRLRDHLYDHLHALPCATHDTADTGDLVQRCTSDVETVRVFLAAQVVEIGRALLLLVSVLPIMVWLDPWMTLLALGLMPVILVFALVFFRKVQHVFLEADEAEARLSSVLQENLTNVRVVRAFCQQPFEQRKFDAENADFRDAYHRMMRLLAHYWALSDFLCLTQVGVLLVGGAWWVQSGNLSVGALFAFVGCQNLVLWPMRHLGRVLSDMGKALVSLRRLSEVLAWPEEGAGDEEAAEPRPLQGRLEARGLSFRYAGGAEVLRDLHFVLEPGQTLALLGPPGSGKSTLAHLLLRLYDPPRGTVFLDGVDLLDWPREVVRGQAGAVLQEPWLASRSLADNLRFGRAEADDEELVAVCREASVHDAIASFAEGYGTVVGERGVTLSGGQRQRVALARALLREPRLTILDDALSAVDTQTETRIVEALRRRAGRGTTVVVAHRLSTVQHADRILVLDAGRVVQQGSHAELVAADGPYRRLWIAQGGHEEVLRRGEGGGSRS